ncbi:MAG: hypothetical protein CMJ48_14795 [Planctomycetaceae bacterium]|nr:hypothetical protein [Planctomycetaceae bacterium]
MDVTVGDVVEMCIFKEMDYAVWGHTQGLIGFVHLFEFADERPIPEDRVPHVGDVVRARVIHVADSMAVELPRDVSCSGTISVDFGATLRHARAPLD